MAVADVDAILLAWRVLNQRLDSFIRLSPTWIESIQ